MGARECGKIKAKEGEVNGAKGGEEVNGLDGVKEAGVLNGVRVAREVGTAMNKELTGMVLHRRKGNIQHLICRICCKGS